MPLLALSREQHSTSSSVMNMSRTRSTASTISTFFNPIKRSLGFKKTSRGTNALYRAISSENWELVIAVSELKPYKAEKWHNAVGFFDAHRSSKILPLHQACIFHPTRDAISAIVQAYPFALQAKESGYGRLPLHIACHSNASFECICELIKSYPAASLERDSIGRVPLHYALSNGAALDVVEELFKAALQVSGDEGHRYICSVADFNGWLPIHVACFMGASSRVLSLIVKSYPEGVTAETKKKSTPMALLNGISLSPKKKTVLEAILLRTRKSKDTFTAASARTDIDRVVRMSDETCSRGVTLEIDEDETSSLSSIEDTSTARTGGLKRNSNEVQFGCEPKKVDPNSNVFSPSSRRSIASPSLLPTHDAYKQTIDVTHANQNKANVTAYPYQHAERVDFATQSSGISNRSKSSGIRSSASSADNNSSTREVVRFETKSSGTFC